MSTSAKPPPPKRSKFWLLVLLTSTGISCSLVKPLTMCYSAPQSPNGEKFKFDLMVSGCASLNVFRKSSNSVINLKEHVFLLQAPPPGKLSPERDDFNVFDPDHKLQGPDIEMVGGFS